MQARYDTIYKDLLEQIESGTYSFGDFIPSERELCEKYSCSHNTLRRALGLLSKGGYIQPINGVGVKVIYRPTERALFDLGGIETFVEAMSRSQVLAITQVVVFEDIICDEKLAAKSGFEPGDVLTHIDRVRILNGKRQIIDHNYFLKRLVPGLTPEIAERSIFLYLEEELHMVVSTSQRTYTAEKATANDRDHLDLGDYDFVAVVSNHTFNSEGKLFEYTVSRHHPEGFSFSTTATRGI